jgi:membrane-bound metal-dependent hydrolase YbcI (DUF457 family)
MDFFSHFIIAILFASYLLKGMDIVFFYYAVFMAILADLDVFLEIIPKFRNSQLLSHKGVSHSIVGAILISFFPSVLLFSLMGTDFIATWIIGAAFYFLHIFFDFLTASKIPIVYPFSKKKYRFFIDRAVNPFLMIISISILIVSIIFRFLNPSILFFYLFPSFALFYSLYFLNKCASKIIVKFKLPENSKYIPGLYPFDYYIYKYANKESYIRYQLFKKTYFKNQEQKLIDTQIDKNSKEMALLDKALELTKNYSFFSKWDSILPIISENDHKIRVSLLLGETYMSNQAYALNVIYKKDSDLLLDQFDGFNEKF